jgi:hypothetical protein
MTPFGRAELESEKATEPFLDHGRVLIESPLKSDSELTDVLAVFVETVHDLNTIALISELDTEKQDKAAQLDGCYLLKTSVATSPGSADTSPVILGLQTLPRTSPALSA